MKLKHTKVTTLAATLITFGSLAGGANAATLINFSSSSGSNSVQSQGFTFSTSSPMSSITTNSNNWAGDGDYFVVWNNSSLDTQFTLVENMGSVFTLNSLDVGSYISGSNNPDTLTFQGFNSGSLVVSETFTDGSDYNSTVLSTLNFSGFTAIDELVVIGSGSKDPRISIDNVSLNVVSVPEPSSALLLGLAALGMVTRRKRTP